MQTLTGIEKCHFREQMRPAINETTRHETRETKSKCNNKHYNQ